MSNYKIVKFTNPDDNQVKYLAVQQGCFTEIPHADCYAGCYGEEVDHDNADDVITILSENTLQVVFEHLRETDEDLDDLEDSEMPYQIGDYIRAYGDYELFMLVYDNQTLENGVDYDLEQVMVEAYTYHDGSNFRTVILNDAVNETAYESVDDETEFEFNRVIDNMEFDHKCGYWTRYRSECGKWFIYDHHTQGSWERYSIEELVEEEYC